MVLEDVYLSNMGMLVALVAVKENKLSPYVRCLMSIRSILGLHVRVYVPEPTNKWLRPS